MRSSQVSEIMLTEYLSAHYDDSAIESAKVMAEYNLLALPVVDENNEIQGIITADDAVALLLPQDLHDRLPRVSI